MSETKFVNLNGTLIQVADICYVIETGGIEYPYKLVFCSQNDDLLLTRNDYEILRPILLGKV